MKSHTAVYMTLSGCFGICGMGCSRGNPIEEGTIQQGNKQKNEKRIHPTQKPINLYRWIAKKYIQSGWKVLDTHTGSASSLIAYHQAGLQFVAFEKDKYMYDLSTERYKAETAQMNLFDFIGGLMIGEKLRNNQS